MMQYDTEILELKDPSVCDIKPIELLKFCYAYKSKTSCLSS